MLNYLFFFRYGREDEELMGLRFSNEIILATEQIFPTPVEVACGSVSKPPVNDLVRNFDTLLAAILTLGIVVPIIPLTKTFESNSRTTELFQFEFHNCGE